MRITAGTRHPLHSTPDLDDELTLPRRINRLLSEARRFLHRHRVVIAMDDAVLGLIWLSVILKDAGMAPLEQAFSLAQRYRQYHEMQLVDRSFLKCV